jgi:hypothetical protein
MVPAIIALIPFVAATACMILSVMRLVGIARHGHDYGILATAADRKGNVKPALIFFYAVVLAQGVISIFWFIIIVDRAKLAARISRKYFGTDDKGKKMVDRYVTELLDTCISKGVHSTNNRTLVLFASELLQSEDVADNVSAVLVLKGLITRNEREAQAVEQICSSKLFIQSLMRLLCSNSIPLDTKLTTAVIIKNLASKLRLADIPGGANSILYLLGDSFMTAPREREAMFFLGLSILDDLAGDPGNCTEIYNTPDLVSKIIAPVCHGLNIANNNDATLKASLRVVAKLTSGMRQSSRELRRKLSENRRTDGYLLRIIRNTEDQDMKLLAAAILSRLTLGDELQAEYADVQKVFIFQFLGVLSKYDHPSFFFSIS